MSQGLRVAGVVESVQSAPASTILLDYVGSQSPIYVGWADPGTTTNTARWRIARIDYDSNANPVDVLWAGGAPTHTQVWDNRAVLSYT